MISLALRGGVCASIRSDHKTHLPVSVYVSQGCQLHEDRRRPSPLLTLKHCVKEEFWFRISMVTDCLVLTAILANRVEITRFMP